MRLIWSAVLALGAIFALIDIPKIVRDQHELMCDGWPIADLRRLASQLGDCSAYDKPPPQAGPQQPDAALSLESKFAITPLYFGDEVIATVKKQRTHSGGSFALFACSMIQKRMPMVGQTSYASTAEDIQLNIKLQPDSLMHEDATVFLLRLEPNDGTPITILAPWNVPAGRRIAPPASREGLLTCSDIHGWF